MAIDMKPVYEAARAAAAPLKMLCTQGPRIVDADGAPVTLRGCNIGSWMNMEYYLYGIYGSEHILRRMGREILGEEKGRFLFDSMMDHFFNEDDVAYLKSIGNTALRLPMNYRHFEDEEHPGTYREEGFRRVDQVLDWCEKYGLYVILDMHAVPGCQSGNWCSDNATGEAHFWHNEYFYRRFLRLWEEFARRYRGRSVVAGYNILNEPVTVDRIGNLPIPVAHDWDELNALHRRTVAAIRAIDPEHIIFLEGDQASSLFHGMEPPFAENLVYSSHNYSFSSGAVTARFYPGLTPDGRYCDREAIREEFYRQEGTAFCQEHQVPLWVGEFGSRSYSEIIDDQIGVFEEFGAHWTIWQHKDIGFSSPLRYHPKCPYLLRFQDLISRFGTVYGGNWGAEETPARRNMREKCREFEDALMTAAQSPYVGEASHYMLSRWVDDGYYAKIMAYEYFKRYEEMSLEEIDRMFADSFELRNCVEHPHVRVLRKYCK